MTPSAELPEAITLQPVGAVCGSIRPPGSKSLSNRALICAALADGTSRLTGLLDSQDTRVMVTALQQVGLHVEPDWPGATVVLQGRGGSIPADSAEIDIANSGTSVRFLTAMLCLGRGRFRVDGNPRMRQRPIADLVDALRQLGGQLECPSHTGCPPVEITAGGLSGGHVEIRGNISSQFLSGLLMAAPYASGPVEIQVVGPLVSVPYVEMTLQVIQAFGGQVSVQQGAEGLRYSTQPHCYRAGDYQIEPDASAASYFAAAAAVTGGQVTLEGLSRHSLQGDVEFFDKLAAMGCQVTWAPTSVTVQGGSLRGISADMNAISDTVMTLAVVALFAETPTMLTNIAHIRHKETDRLAAVAAELRKLGASVDEQADRLHISPGELKPARLATYDDHRMAMSLALVGLRIPGVIIEDPGCTRKTYPQYFDDLCRLANTRWSPTPGH